MAFKPPVSAISGTNGRSSSASRLRAMAFAMGTDPVNTTPAMRTSPVRAAPTSPPPTTSCSAGIGNSCLMMRGRRHNAPIARCLRRRLCHNGIARDQRRRNLSEKDCQREIPRCNSHPNARGLHGAARFARQLVLAVRPASKSLRCAGRVITAEIDSFAHFGERVRELSLFAS